MSPRAQVLGVDAAWTPSRWLRWDDVLGLYARGLVEMSLGQTAFTLRGGVNARTGRQSILEVGSILVLNTRGRLTAYDRVPAFSRELLFHRDRHVCAYCGERFRDRELTVEHIVPVSRGGSSAWTNVVAACRSCNVRKNARTPEEASMPLLYVPYVPSHFEDLLVQNRNILADQMDFVCRHLPKTSRLRGTLLQ